MCSSSSSRWRSPRLAGVLAARRWWWGAAVFVAFGIVGLVAALRDPLAMPALTVANTALAAGVGLATLRWLVALATVRVPRRVEPRTTGRASTKVATGSMPDWDRRRFLLASAGTLGGAVVAGGLGRSLVDAQHPTGVVSTSRLPAGAPGGPATRQ